MKKRNSMLKKWVHGLFVSSVALAVTACGGGGQTAKPAENGGSTPPANREARCPGRSPCRQLA